MRLAVLGLGFMGSTHIKGILTLPNVQLTAICSDDAKALTGDMSGIQGNLGGPGERFDFTDVHKYREIDEALADPEVEAVDLCLPTHLHAPVAIQALRAGKHVLVEKPMALSTAEVDAMVAEAAKQKRVLMVAHVLRFFPAYQALKDALPGLGAVRSAMFRRRCAAPGWSQWLADRTKSGGGVFDLLIHDVDTVLWLFGKPTHVSATGFEALADGVDMLDARLHYADEFTVNITGGWHHPKSYPFSMEYTVVADGGTVDYSSAGRAPMLFNAGGGQPLPLGTHDGYAEEIRYFADCVETGRQPDRCTPQSSAESTKLALLLRDSRSSNGERIPCRL